MTNGRDGKRWASVWATAGDAPGTRLERPAACSEVINSPRSRLVSMSVWRLASPVKQLARSNVREILVSNLMANRIAALDRASVHWRKFYDVNFPARLPTNRGPDGLFLPGHGIPWTPGSSAP